MRVDTASHTKGWAFCRTFSLLGRRSIRLEAMLRLFLALELPQKIRQQLRVMQGRFNFSGREIKWVEENNLHLTLHFLGSVPTSRLTDLCYCTNEVTSQTRAFVVEVRGLGVFPLRGKPRVVWAGISEGCKNLQLLYQSLIEVFQRVGFAIEERPYTPHVTLGRIRSPIVSFSTLRQVLRQYNETPFGTYLAREVALFKSILTPAGPVYTVLERFPLAGSTSTRPSAQE